MEDYRSLSGFGVKEIFRETFAFRIRLKFRVFERSMSFKGLDPTLGPSFIFGPRALRALGFVVTSLILKLQFVALSRLVQRRKHTWQC